MFKTIARLALLLSLGFCSCGTKEEPAAQSDQNESQEQKPAGPKADPPKAPLVGEPTGSGYTSQPIRVQVGPDEGLREQQTPAAGMQFLFVRLKVAGPQVLVPKDYRIVIQDKQYTPHAVGFGRPNGILFSVEYFVGDRVELTPGTDDRIMHDDERIEKTELRNPMVFLVYEVPKTENPTLRHGAASFFLNPDYESLAADLSGDGGTLTAKTQVQMPDPNAASSDFSAALQAATRTRMELNGTPADVLVLTVALRATKKTEIELNKSNISLRGGEGRATAGTIYFHFSTKDAALTAGSSYTEGETYQDRDLIGLASGSFRLPLSPENGVTATIIFPDPKLSGDLEVALSPSVAVEVPEPVNPLGKFPPPIEKMPAMVAWVPMVGTPIDAGYLPEAPSMAADFKQLSSPAPSKPGEGLRHLMVRFRVEKESQFVPIDYRIAEQESNTIYRPVAAAFGESPVYVKGLTYEKLPLRFGNTTAPELQGVRLKGWTLKTPEVTLLYEVAPAPEFVFIHGETQFVIEPN